MGYKIVYKPYAERDIWEIAEGLADYSAPAAKRFLGEVKRHVERLSDMPNSCPKLSANPEYRKMVVGKYVVLYCVDDYNRQVLIVRVVHGMRNYRIESGGADEQ